MQSPMRAIGEPVGVEIRDQQSGLEKDEASNPDRGRSAKDRHKLLGGHGLDEEEQEGAKKDGRSEEQS